jgi:anti-anti-sigma regulatory factor/anti-sigma regulatory factor (Ser/Thr protein kinase)
MLISEAYSAAGSTVVRLIGQLDLITTVDARATLHKVLAAQPTAIVVDVSDLSVVDDVTLTVFSAFARSASDWPGCPVLILAPDPAMRVALDLLAISRRAPVYPDRAAALAAADAVPVPRRHRCTVPIAVAALSIARRLIREECLAWQLPELIDDAELIITELVSNAVVHGAAPVALTFTLREHFLHMSVHDGSPVLPKRVLPDPDTGAGGRGLLLVDAVAAGWGTTPVADGKAVWATLRVKR